MRRKYHFCVSYTKHLEKYLQEEAIRYNVAENLLAFDLYDDDMAYHLFIKRFPWHRFFQEAARRPGSQTLPRTLR